MTNPKWYLPVVGCGRGGWIKWKGGIELSKSRHCSCFLTADAARPAASCFYYYVLPARMECVTSNGEPISHPSLSSFCRVIKVTNTINYHGNANRNQIQHCFTALRMAITKSSVVRSICCPSRGPWLDFQPSRADSQPTTCSTSSRGIAPSSGLFRHQACAWDTYIHIGKHVYTWNKNILGEGRDDFSSQEHLLLV